jgi:urease accessory protein
MARDARKMRGERPFLFTNLKSGAGLPDVIAWIQRELLYETAGSGNRVIG